MKLYLVRHGRAVNSNVDPLRPLSQAGRAEVEKVARHLESLGVQVAEVRHSVKARAAQTAEIIASRLAGCRLIQVDGLAPEDPIKPVANEVKSFAKDLMLVGHLPFLPVLAAVLLGTAARSAETLSFPTACVVIMDRNEQGLWSVLEQIWPEKIEG